MTEIAPAGTALPLSQFSELAVLLIICAGLGAVFVRLRQPLLITYIVAGILVGPAGTGLVQSHSSIEAFAQLGITVLLFIVGLKLDLQHVRHIGPVALATGLGQLAFTIVLGFLITMSLGKSWIEAVYISVALTFSSTIIIVKLLSDKRELDSLHGRIAVGFLVVQDLAVVIAMMIMSALRDAGGESVLVLGISMFLRIGGVVLLTFVMMRWVLPRLLSVMARSQEYSQPLFERLSPWLSWFERKRPFRELDVESEATPLVQIDAIVFGLGRYGGRILERLLEAEVQVVGVDFDPEVVRDFREQGLPVRFGDGEDADFVETLPLRHARWVIITLPQWEVNRGLIQALRSAGFAGSIAVAVRDLGSDEVLGMAGVQRVIRPFSDAADHAAQGLIEALRAPT